MKITDFLDASLIIPNLKGKDKNTVLKEMVEAVASHCRSIDSQKLFRVLVEREKISSTAIGEGVAIPHGKLAGIDRVYGVFGRSSEGLDFNALDGELSYLFFLLVAPEEAGGDHLKALARISRLLKDATFRAKLMEGKTREEIFRTIKEGDEKA